jgi:Animal haem peroxidase
MGGDIYFYSHPENPHPFTTQQLEVIQSASFSQIICTTTGLDSIPKVFFLAENEFNNTKVPCSNFKRFDVSAWNNI